MIQVVSFYLSDKNFEEAKQTTIKIVHHQRIRNLFQMNSYAQEYLLCASSFIALAYNNRLFVTTNLNLTHYVSMVLVTLSCTITCD